DVGHGGLLQACASGRSRSRGADGWRCAALRPSGEAAGSRRVDPAGVAGREGPPGAARNGSDAAKPRHGAEVKRSPAAGQPRTHSVVTDSTMTMARTKGTSLVIRQNRPDRVEVPA